jgi:hypothetical protein
VTSLLTCYSHLDLSLPLGCCLLLSCSKPSLGFSLHSSLKHVHTVLSCYLLIFLIILHNLFVSYSLLFVFPSVLLNISSFLLLVS